MFPQWLDLDLVFDGSSWMRKEMKTHGYFSPSPNTSSCGTFLLTEDSGDNWPVAATTFGFETASRPVFFSVEILSSMVSSTGAISVCLSLDCDIHTRAKTTSRGNNGPNELHLSGCIIDHWRCRTSNAFNARRLLVDLENGLSYVLNK